MKKMLILLISILVFLSIGCATDQPARKSSPGVTFKTVVSFEKLNEQAQKEAVKFGYGPGDDVRIDMRDGKSEFVPKR
jgi:hypothetical protein